MKEIENIFSKSQIKDNCPNPKTQIIIDTREKNSMILANLIELKANIKKETLEIGDYIIGDIVIERKTYNDLINSLFSKRLFSQLNELKKYEKCFLILEGNFAELNSKINKNALRGTILSIITDYQIPIIYTETEKHTAETLILLAKKEKKEISLREKKSMVSAEEKKQFILEGFPEIGATKAKLLLQKYPNLKSIFNSTEKELGEIISLKTAQEFVKILNL